MNFNFPNNIGHFILAVFLILYGLRLLIPVIAIPMSIFGILALASGIFILIGK